MVAIDVGRNGFFVVWIMCVRVLISPRAHGGFMELADQCVRIARAGFSGANDLSVAADDVVCLRSLLGLRHILAFFPSSLGTGDNGAHRDAECLERRVEISECARIFYVEQAACLLFVRADPPCQLNLADASLLEFLDQETLQPKLVATSSRHISLSDLLVRVASKIFAQHFQALE